MFDRTSGCWDTNIDGGKDVERIFRNRNESGLNVIEQWMELVELLDQGLPVFGMGVTSGSTFLLKAHQMMSLQAMAMYGGTALFKQNGTMQKWPPTAFVVMKKDSDAVEAAETNSDELLLSGVHTMVVSINPRPLTPSRCSERLPEFGDRRCLQLASSLQRPEFRGLVDHTSHLIKQSTWGGAWDGVLQFILKEDQSTSKQQQNIEEEDTRGQIPKTSFNGRHSRMYVALEQIIDASFGRNDISSERVEDIIDWMKEKIS